MSKGSFNVLELHAEKIVLGLGGVVLLYMMWAYLISSPNVVKYGGVDVSPSELDDKILADARGLETAVRSASGKSPEFPKYTEQVKHLLSSGVLATPTDGGPPVAASLRRSAAFGTKIEYPGAKPHDGSGGGGVAIALVQPLAPEPPLARTGRSLAVVGPVKAPWPGPTPGEGTEVSWVNIAAYFPLEKQQDEFKNAGYSEDKQRVYLAGVEVQRQELLASGEWSDWSDVTSRAALQLDIHKPVIDPATGAVRNSAEVKDDLNVLKTIQRDIMQPQFHTVKGGEPWGIPDMPGLKGGAAAAPPSAGAGPGPGGVRPPEGGPPGKPEEPPTPGGGGGRKAPPAPQPPTPPPPSGGGGRRAPGGPGAVSPGGPGPSGQNPDKALREEAAERLKEAEKLFQQKEYDAAMTAIEAVLSNTKADTEVKSKAKVLQKKIEEAKSRAAASTSAQPVPGGELMTREDGSPAVWFNDDSVVAGKTYRYRLRVQVWNRYVGQLRSVKNPDDAKTSTIASKWSEPTDPVTVAPTAYFFVRGGKGPAGNVASIEVWKWHEGEWLHDTFDVAAGDNVGGPKKDKSKKEIDYSTGMVVIDVRKEMVKPRKAGKEDAGFSYSPEVEAIVVSYVDPVDGQVKERNSATFRTDPIRKKLADEKGES